MSPSQYYWQKIKKLGAQNHIEFFDEVRLLVTEATTGIEALHHFRTKKQELDGMQF